MCSCSPNKHGVCLNTQLYNPSQLLYLEFAVKDKLLLCSRYSLLFYTWGVNKLILMVNGYGICKGPVS